MVAGLIGLIVFTLDVEAKLTLFFLPLVMDVGLFVARGNFVVDDSSSSSSSCLIFGEKSSAGWSTFTGAVCRLFVMSKLSWRNVVVRSTQRDELLATCAVISVALTLLVDFGDVGDGMVLLDLMVAALIMVVGSGIKNGSSINVTAYGLEVCIRAYFSTLLAAARNHSASASRRIQFCVCSG